MSDESKPPLLRRCWRAVGPWIPEAVREPFKGVLRVLLAPFRRRPPADILPDDLSRQLDAILRELRRLHVRMDELQNVRHDPRAIPTSTTLGRREAA